MAFVPVIALASLMVGVGAEVGAPVKLVYAFNLSALEGPLPLHQPWISYDATAHEVYVVQRELSLVRVFNDSGMQVHTFGEDGSLGDIISVASLRSGDLLVVSNIAGATRLTRCNYRGVPVAELTLSGDAVSDLRDFVLESATAVDGKLYLLSRVAKQVLVADLDGRVQRSINLASVAGLDAEMARDNDIAGLSVDVHGNILFTIPTLFSAYIVSTVDGDVRQFGKRGSSPGRFNLVSGIVADEQGLVYVADTLRSVVMVFDDQLAFRGEYGYRGWAAGSLISPRHLVVGGDKVFVTQSARRGVSAFRVVMPPKVEPTT
ncbi:MAG: hypothetical protein AAB426_11240 [Myxococcota bacterium]